MRVLVDSHVFLWAVLEDPRLSLHAREIWLDEQNQLLISAASLWEIAIKVGLGKLAIDRPLKEFYAEELAKNSLILLPISADHAAALAALPPVHRDPFDRMIVAQAISEELSLLSADKLLDAYGIRREW
jgi:PIN domain nuclease of toxin-antitoxin system